MIDMIWYFDIDHILSESRWKVARRMQTRSHSWLEMCYSLATAKVHIKWTKVAQKWHKVLLKPKLPYDGRWRCQTDRKEQKNCQRNLSLSLSLSLALFLFFDNIFQIVGLVAYNMGRKLGPFHTINGATARLGSVASSAFRQTQKAGEPLPEIVSVPLAPKENTACPHTGHAHL